MHACLVGQPVSRLMPLSVAGLPVVLELCSSPAVMGPEHKYGSQETEGRRVVGRRVVKRGGSVLFSHHSHIMREDGGGHAPRFAACGGGDHRGGECTCFPAFLENGLMVGGRRGHGEIFWTTMRAGVSVSSRCTAALGAFPPLLCVQRSRLGAASSPPEYCTHC